MENIESLWQQLENPVPACMEFVPDASVKMGHFEKQNQLLKVALIGLGVIAVGAIIYVFYNSRKDEKRKAR